MALDNYEAGRNPKMRGLRNPDPAGHIPDDTFTQVVMGDIHAYIHDGRFYIASYISLSLANNAELDILIRVTDVMHVRPFVSSSGESIVDFYEGSTFSAVGTELDAINRNRFSPRAATTSIFHTPTITDVGSILLSQTLMPGGQGGNATGGSGASDFEEWILAPGDHLFRITNIGGAAKNVSMQLNWYEPDFPSG